MNNIIVVYLKLLTCWVILHDLLSLLTFLKMIMFDNSFRNTVKHNVKLPLSKRPKDGFQDQKLLNEGRKYCRMLQGEHSAILSTFIELSFVIKIFVLSILSG